MVVVIAGGGSARKKEAVALPDFVTFQKKCQQVGQVHAFRRTGEKADIRAKLLVGQMSEIFH